MRSRLPAALALAGVLALTACTGPAPASEPTGSASSTPSATPTPSPTPSGEPVTAASIGDSISRGFDACSHFGDCPAASWSTGSDRAVGSVAARLQAATGRPVTVASVAKSGSTSEDLERQAGLAALRSPDLVTLLIGGNDVCRATVDEMTPTAVFAARVSTALALLSSRAPDATVLVASVPDVTALLPAAAKDPTARFVWQRAGGCATVLDEPQSRDPEAEARRQAVRLRIAEYNAALQTACAAASACIWDDGALAAYRPTLEQLSAFDAFHPSIAGQRELARLEWEALVGSGRFPLLAAG